MDAEVVIDHQMKVGQGSVSVDNISSKRKDQSSGVHFEVGVKSLVERMFRYKRELKDIKHALKAYKVTSDNLEALKKSRKEFTQQINQEKDLIEAEFQKDSAYNKLREQILDCEEKIAVAKQDLKMVLREKSQENEIFEMVFDVDGQPFKLQTQSKVALYFNGKEEK